MQNFQSFRFSDLQKIILSLPHLRLSTPWIAKRCGGMGKSIGKSKENSGNKYARFWVMYMENMFQKVGLKGSYNSSALNSYDKIPIISF